MRRERSATTLGNRKRGVVILLFVMALNLSTAHAEPPSLDNPNFHDYWHHKDGSDRYSLELGGNAGFSTGATKRIQNTSGGFRVGGGYNVNKLLSVMLDIDYSNAGIPSSAIATYYNSLDTEGSGVTGRVHLWSATANPVLHHHWSERSDSYLVGGGGFYRRTITFNSQEQSTCAGCVNPPTPLGHVSNNASGWSFGTGYARTVTFDSYVKWFIEARYVWIDSKPASHFISYSPVTFRTGSIPVTVGLRW